MVWKCSFIFLERRIKKFVQTTVSVSVMCVCVRVTISGRFPLCTGLSALRHWVSIPAKPLAKALSYCSSYFLHFIQAGVFPFLALCEAECVLHQPNGWDSTWDCALAFHGAGQHPLLRLALLLPCSSHCPEFLLLCKKLQERGMCHQKPWAVIQGSPDRAQPCSQGASPGELPRITLAFPKASPPHITHLTFQIKSHLLFSSHSVPHQRPGEKFRGVRILGGAQCRMSDSHANTTYYNLSFILEKMVQTII